MCVTLVIITIGTEVIIINITNGIIEPTHWQTVCDIIAVLLFSPCAAYSFCCVLFGRSIVICYDLWHMMKWRKNACAGYCYADEFGQPIAAGLINCMYKEFELLIQPANLNIDTNPSVNS